MSVHVCNCTHNGEVEWHIRYPGMSEEAAQNLADRINSGSVLDMASARGHINALPTNERNHMKFRKKPVVIEAFQMTPERRESNSEWLPWMHRAWQLGRAEPGSLHPTIEGDGEGTLSITTTLEGEHLVSWGDWVIQGVAGELYPCKPEIFAATYEPAD